jgi:hypothetical protein
MDDLIRRLELIVAASSIEDVLTSLSDVCKARAEFYDAEGEPLETVQYWDMLSTEISAILTIKK